MNLEIKPNIQNKHVKYINDYIKNDIFWGLGIENEVYLEFENKKNVNRTFFLNNHKRERYSVNYYTNYKENFKNEVFKYVWENNKLDHLLYIFYIKIKIISWIFFILFS